MKKLLCLLLACVLLLSSCQGMKTDKNDDGKIIIAASFYPVYIFTLNLADGIDEFQVQCMAEQNIGCLHDYTLTSKDVKLLNDSAVLVINGAGMEGFIEDVFANAENLKVIDSSKNVHLLCDEADHHREEQHNHNHNHEGNSHIWLSVENAKIQVENIKNDLVELFPEYSEKISDNYNSYMNRLDLLCKERDSFSQQVKGSKVISFHRAYEYLAQETGLCISATVESDEGGEPSAKKLAGLIDIIEKEKVKALFLEPRYEGSGAEILQRETNVNVYVLNPVIKGEATLTAYEDIMSQNYKTILKAVK